MARFLDRQREKEGVKWGAFWWTVSIIAHLTGVFLLVYFTPLRERFMSREDPNDNLARVSGKQVSDTVRTMLIVHTQRMAEDIEKGRRDLGEIDSRRDRAYKRYEEEGKYILTSRRDAPPIVPLAAIQTPNVTEIDVRKVKLTDKSLFDLYKVAQQVERAAIESYREMQAIELSRLQRVDLEVANKATKIPYPDHPPILERHRDAEMIKELNDAAKPYIDYDCFFEPITNITDGRMGAVKTELGEMRSEVASMVAAIRRMLDLAKGLIGDDVGGTLAGDGGGIMTHFGDENYAGRGRAEDGLFQGYTPMDPKAFDHAWGHGAGPVSHKDELFPREQAQNLGAAKPVPGRKIMKEGTRPGTWMYVDIWYIIGPFENPNRDLIDHKFPPEAAIDTGIDLDAQYFGWQNKPVRWQFRRSPDVCVIPHEPKDGAIWYAYTELFSDKDQERICIFGSDDYGKAWIIRPGEPAEAMYGSGKTPHPWIPDRMYKKVKFSKGFNRVLFKLENAWGRTGFSMAVLMEDNQAESSQ
jgi:hypothetical protein